MICDLLLIIFDDIAAGGGDLEYFSSIISYKNYDVDLDMHQNSSNCVQAH